MASEILLTLLCYLGYFIFLKSLSFCISLNTRLRIVLRAADTLVKIRPYMKLIQRLETWSILLSTSEWAPTWLGFPFSSPSDIRTQNSLKITLDYLTCCLYLLKKLSKEPIKVNPSPHDWFLQSIQQYLVDYMCLSLKKKKMTVELQLKRRNILDKNESSIIHNAEKKDSIVQSESSVGLL